MGTREGDKARSFAGSTVATTSRLAVLCCVLGCLDLTARLAAPSPEPRQALHLPQGGATAQGPRDAECRDVGLYVDANRNRRRQHTPDPLVTIVYVATQPGGYDMVLNSLAAQAKVKGRRGEWELVCVDELASYRAQRVYALADSLSLPLVAVVPPKPLSPGCHSTQPSTNNAINTALLLSRGKVVVVTRGMVWLPVLFVSRVFEFYSSSDHANAMLGFPEQRFTLSPLHVPTKETMQSNNLVTIFASNLTSAPSALSDAGLAPAQDKRTTPMFLQGKRVPDASPELGWVRQPLPGQAVHLSTPVAIPFSCLQQLNGLDECHDSVTGFAESVRVRCSFLGFDVFLDCATSVETVPTKADRATGAPTQGSRHSMDMIELVGELASGNRPVHYEGHGFDLAQWREASCAVRV